jgi:hypothetical protein
MQPSPELRALIEQSFRHLAAKNAEALLAQESHEPGTVFIGTDPKEWFESLAGWEPVVRTVAANSAGGMPADLQIQAMQEGTVGWAAYHWTGHLPDGRILTFRATSICHQENGEWKEVHFHVSLGVPDELAPNVAQPAG